MCAWRPALPDSEEVDAGLKRIFGSLAYGAMRAGLRVPHSGSFERLARLQRLASLLRQTRPGVVLDVGANKGWFAVEMRKLGFDGPIVSFEPNPEDAAHLRRKAAGDASWQITQVGLGRAPGRIPFRVIETGRASS